METVNELSAPQTPAPPESAQTAPAQLAGKRANWTIAHEVQGTMIRWQVKGAGTLALDLSKCSEKVRERAAVHGMVQRVSDAAAMARNSKTGASASPQEKFEAMSRLVEHYQSGAEGWSPTRAEGGARGVKVNPQKALLVRALSIHAPEKGAEVIEKFVSERNAAQITALLLSEQLKEAVELAREQLREEEKKIAEGVDALELLKGL